ncbi:MAG: acetate--CoA ligase family protein [Rhodoferax sp.]|nr:acetate--CoA ligase family protein [Rhodoferax sp.]
MKALSALLEPASIALVGASPDAGKLAGRPLSYLQRYGYQGKVYAVNPKYKDIAGIACFPSISELPRDIDLALILLPAHGVADALEQCALQGVKCAISIAGGFAEAGGQAEQDRLSEICQQYGIRLVGPNCVGVLHPALGMTATFSSELRNRMPRSGKMALFTQSGALGNALLQSFNDLDIGLAYWVSSGNEADVGLLDLVEHALDDDNINLITLYVEGLKHGERLLSLAKRARQRKKAIVVLRAGKSQLGRAAAVSHTGKLAGAWKVWQDVARQAGLISVDTLDELLDVAIVFDSLGFPEKSQLDGLGVLTVSGGMGVLISDGAAEYNLPLPTFSASTQLKLRSLLPAQMTVANPVDTALFTDEKGFAGCAEAVLQDDNVGVLLVVMTRLAHDYKAMLPWLERLSQSARQVHKCVAISYLSSSDAFEKQDRQRLMQSGALILPTPDRLVAALGHRYGVKGDLAGVVDPQQNPARSQSIADFLALGGVPQLPEGLFQSVDEAVNFAAVQGYPVVLKVSSADVPHKTEAGGVALNLMDEDSLRMAWARMVSSVQAYAPHANIDGYTVQPMILDGFELIVGCSVDPELGRVLMVGAGGVWAEVLDDVCFLALPTSEAEIEAVINSLRVAPILAGARGQAPLDVAAATQVIHQLAQQFMVDDWVLEVDINPLRVRTKGLGVVALDTLVVAKN